MVSSCLVWQLDSEEEWSGQYRNDRLRVDFPCEVEHENILSFAYLRRFVRKWNSVIIQCIGWKSLVAKECRGILSETTSEKAILSLRTT